MTHPMLAIAGETTPEQIAEAQALALVEHQPRALLPAPIEKLREVSLILHDSGIVPHLLNQPGRCLAVAYQAARFGMDAIAFGGKTYFTPVKGGGERMNYESQLIAAILNGSPMLSRRLRVTFHGEKQQRFARVIGYIRGEVEPFEYVSPIIGQIKPKNSPLWFTDPDQQLSYYAQRAWGRRWASDVIMGLYDGREEFTETADDNGVARDPFDESDLPEPEPSGGKGWVPPSTDNDSDQQRQGKQQRKTPEPSGGGDGQSDAEPEDMPAVRAWAAEQQTAILAMTDAAEMDAAGAAMKADKRWKRLKTYNQPVANAIWKTCEARFFELTGAAEKTGEVASDFPGDR